MQDIARPARAAGPRGRAARAKLGRRGAGSGPRAGCWRAASIRTSVRRPSGGWGRTSSTPTTSTRCSGGGRWRRPAARAPGPSSTCTTSGCSARSGSRTATDGRATAAGDATRGPGCGCGAAGRSARRRCTRPACTCSSRICSRRPSGSSLSSEAHGAAAGGARAPGGEGGDAAELRAGRAVRGGVVGRSGRRTRWSRVGSSRRRGSTRRCRAAVAAGVPLVVAGEGPDRPRLESLAAGGDVRFMGLLAPRAAGGGAGSRGRRARAVAVRGGVPVLGARRVRLGGSGAGVGPRRPARAGRLRPALPAEDIGAWSERLAQLWGDPAERERLGAAALDSARERFGEERYYRRA